MKKKSPSSKCSAESGALGLDSGKRETLNVFGPTTMINMPAKPIGKDLVQKNSSRATSRTSEQTQYLSMIYLQRGFRVRVFPLRENAEVFKTKQGELFSTKSAELLAVKDLATYSLRMLKDYFHTAGAVPSRLYSFHWMSLGMMSAGKCLTLNIGCPKTVSASLSSVLEEQVDKKYYISNAMMKYMERKTHHKVPISSPREVLKSPLRGEGDKPMTGEINELKQVGNIDRKGHNSLWGRVYDPRGISTNINAEGGGLGAKTGLYLADPKSRIRRLTPRECERLQGFPDDWSEGVSDTQRYKMMGNAVSVPVIEAIGREILKKEIKNGNRTQARR